MPPDHIFIFFSCHGISKFLPNFFEQEINYQKSWLLVIVINYDTCTATCKSDFSFLHFRRVRCNHVCEQKNIGQRLPTSTEPSKPMVCLSKLNNWVKYEVILYGQKVYRYLQNMLAYMNVTTVHSSTKWNNIKTGFDKNQQVLVLILLTFLKQRKIFGLLFLKNLVFFFINYY